MTSTYTYELNQWIIIDQGEPLKILRMYLQNRTDCCQNRFDNLFICIGNDLSSPTAFGNVCSLVPIHEGGFIILELPAGRYVFLDRRANTTYPFNLSVARVSQTPNLLEPAHGAATILADYESIVGYPKENLTSSLGVRTMRYDLAPVKDAAGNTEASLNSCYSLLAT